MLLLIRQNKATRLEADLPVLSNKWQVAVQATLCLTTFIIDPLVTFTPEAPISPSVYMGRAAAISAQSCSVSQLTEEDWALARDLSPNVTFTA